MMQRPILTLEMWLRWKYSMKLVLKEVDLTFYDVMMTIKSVLKILSERVVTFIEAVAVNFVVRKKGKRIRMR